MTTKKCFISRLTMMIITLQLCFVSVSFAGCSAFRSITDASASGINNFDRRLSEIRLTKYLIPFINGDNGDKLFLSMYPYLQADFYYLEQGFFSDRNLERVFMCLYYEDGVYFDAKNCVLQKLPLSNKNVFDYKKYYFAENLLKTNSLNATDAPAVENDYFPNEFRLVGFNDEDKSLIFIGFSLCWQKTTEDIAALEPFNIEIFLKTYFSEWYDFDS